MQVRDAQVLILVLTWCRVASGFNPFLPGGFGVDQGPAVELLGPAEPERKEGDTPPLIVIEKVVAFPDEGGSDVITLRNMGGQTQDLTGWKLADSDGDGEFAYELGDENCEDQGSIGPAQKLEIFPESEDNPCGFAFNVNFRDEVSLLAADGSVAASVKWDDSEQVTAIRRMSDGSYAVLPEDEDVIATLENLGDFSIFLQALEILGMVDQLKAENDPEYDGVQFPEPPPPPPLEPQFPAWFGFAVNRSDLPPPPPPPPSPPPLEEGIPKLGPYTILAPTDEAFENIRGQIAGPGKDPVSMEYLLELPELRDIILYHILPGAWTSEYLKNNTAIPTTKLAEIVPMSDGAMTEGVLMLHDSCVDKPTPDAITCDDQALFGKCYDPFMVSPLGAQWQGGFCQRSCGRCTCDPTQGTYCAEVMLPDVIASNGVIQVVSRLLFPPPIFEQEEIDGETLEMDLGPMVEPISDLAASSSSLDSVPTGTITASNGPPKPKVILGLKNKNE